MCTVSLLNEEFSPHSALPYLTVVCSHFLLGTASSFGPWLCSLSPRVSSSPGGVADGINSSGSQEEADQLSDQCIFPVPERSHNFHTSSQLQCSPLFLLHLWPLRLLAVCNHLIYICFPFKGIKNEAEFSRSYFLFCLLMQASYYSDLGLPSSSYASTSQLPSQNGNWVCCPLASPGLDFVWIIQPPVLRNQFGPIVKSLCSSF